MLCRQDIRAAEVLLELWHDMEQMQTQTHNDSVSDSSNSVTKSMCSSVHSCFPAQGSGTDELV